MAITKRRSDIRKDLLHQLYWDPKIDDPQDITITVSGTTATLTGTVESSDARRSAAIDALLVPGIKSVDNRLAVAPSGTADDERIAAGIRNALERDTLLTTGIITVGVEKGRVTLAGTVTSRAALRAADEIVRHTKGVLKINNELVILSP
jgi:osmotically-inducible protein OsmY